MYNIILDYLAEDTGTFYRHTGEVASIRTRYQDVRVVESKSFGRCLFIDGKLQSSRADEFIYHEALVHPAMFCHPFPKSVYIAGGGEGATLREVLRHPSVEEVVMVDLDVEVVDLCREYLSDWSRGAFDDDRVTLIHDDARGVLEREDRKYDVMILDLPEPVDESPSRMLFTREFYRLCRDRLTPAGSVATQAGCPSMFRLLPFHSISLTLESVFENVGAYSVFIPSFGSDWGFALAGNGRRPMEVGKDELVQRIAALSGKLRFLDPDYLPSMFNLPKYLKEEMENTGRIIRDTEPLVVI